MADSQLLLKRGSFRSTWLRARKSRTQLVLSRRPRRRLGTLRWCGRRRLRRRLLQAQAAGADWRESSCLVSRAATRRPKTATPSPAPAAAPAPSGPASLPIPPVRPAGPGRALVLLPLEQVGRAEGAAALGLASGEKTLPHLQLLRPQVERIPPGGGAEQG